MEPTENDLPHLRRCVELAAEALEAGDDPFGSVLVDSGGAVVAEDRNRETSTGDPTAHPELALARWAALNLTAEDRAGATIYTSGEHCPMCAAAQGWAGVGRVAYVASSAQLTEWRDGWGLPPSPLAPLSLRDVVPGIEVAGPAPDLVDEIRALHEASYLRRSGRA
ncbi:tRNA(Arg) A34 adenosine deaminase TadA [Nocardioides thalensis]|uniref:tRNA(Arg) A34 adenosine deaminase TadA n=1 Tax=Nocardioides thalensis TaxID=1914755 RepID=A0A853BZI4_9ACTN|nr:tRNA(Arg) A34 adenosine deaminase TadA [Nocardioides thalensis]